MVVIRIFSNPSRNRSRTWIRSSTVSSPESKATAWPSLVIFSTNLNFGKKNHFKKMHFRFRQKTNFSIITLRKKNFNSFFNASSEENSTLVMTKYIWPNMQFTHIPGCCFASLTKDHCLADGHNPVDVRNSVILQFLGLTLNPILPNVIYRFLFTSQTDDL